MRKYLIYPLMSLLLIVAMPTFAQVGVDCSDAKFAQTEFCQEIINNPQTADDNSIIGTLQTVINLLTVVVGVAAVIGIIIGGLQIATQSGGSKDQSGVVKGRRTILYSVVGLGVALLARTIIVFVLGRL